MSLVIAVGTYDGVLAGWELTTKQRKDRSKDRLDDDDNNAVHAAYHDDNDDGNTNKLSLTFATAVHDGSIRSLCMAGSSTNTTTTGTKTTSGSKQEQQEQQQPGHLLSSGYDETLKTHDWSKRLTSSGEIRTPSDFGTPVVSAFAPPAPYHSTHCIVGFSGTNSSSSGGGTGTGNGGKICIYKKRDWSVQHVLSGHDGGVSALAVHPTGKLALSGGITDGKLKLWDLTKGRLAFCFKLEPVRTIGNQAKFDPITSIVWSSDDDGAHYAFSYGSHVTVREVTTGKTVLDVELPSRVNQVALMEVPEGLFLIAACNDGSLPVLAVEELDGEEQEARRAIMAIEPVESHLAREERFKCIQYIRDYYVATANSAGVVSLMNLQGAIRMITDEGETEPDSSDEVDDENDNSSSDSRQEESYKNNNDDDSVHSDDMDMAVEIIDSVRLGTGARITAMCAWVSPSWSLWEETDKSTSDSKEERITTSAEPKTESSTTERKRPMGKHDEFEMDTEAVKRARLLVQQAKKLTQKKGDKKEKKKKKKKKASKS